MADDKITIEQFVRKIKNARPELADVPDEVLFRQVLDRRPDIVEQYVQMYEPTAPHRRDHSQQQPQGSSVGRFLKGAAEPIKEIPGNIKDTVKEAGPSAMSWLLYAGGAGKKPQTAGVGDVVDSALDRDKIGAHEQKGDWAGAAGRATTDALGMVLPFAKKWGKSVRPLDEMTNIGKGLKVDAAALEAAQVVSKDASALLDSQIAGIDKGMAGQFVDVKGLRADIAKAAKMMDRLERAPGMQVKDISAAKDVVARLSKRAKAGMLTWQDAREFYKEIGNASTTTKGASALRNSLNTIKDSLEKQLQAAAKAGGKEAEFNKWMADYRDLKRWQRGYAKTVTGKTPQQLEAAASATPGVKIPKTNIRVGGSDPTGKVAKGQIKTAHKALEDLTKRIKSSPSGATPPTAPPAGGAAPINPGPGQVMPPPKQLPPAGSTQMPAISQSTAGQMMGQQQSKMLPPASSIQLPASSATPPASIQGGSGEFSRTPRANPAEHPEPPPAQLKVPPNPEIQKAIQDILGKMNKNPF